VDANFAAELKSLVLTAGHDADLLELPITIDSSVGDEEFFMMNGKNTIIKPNDMIMCDQKGVVCSIIYGQDNRTYISKNTSRAMYVAYAPEGVPLSSVELQLDAITDYVLLASPNANIELQKIFSS